MTDPMFMFAAGALFGFMAGIAVLGTVLIGLGLAGCFRWRKDHD